MPKLRDDRSIDPVVHIYFGSVTGNSEYLANLFSQLLLDRDIDSDVAQLSNFNESRFLKHSIVVLFVSTAGEGDVTDDAKDFCHFMNLKDSLIFLRIHYLVLGLGDRNYLRFCGAAKLIDRMMSRLGGQPIFPIGFIDSSRSLEIEFNEWLSCGVVNALDKEVKKMRELTVVRPVVKRIQANSKLILSENFNSHFPYSKSVEPLDVLSRVLLGLEKFMIRQKRQLRKCTSEISSTVHIELQFPGRLTNEESFSLSTIEILPENPVDVIKYFSNFFAIPESLLNYWISIEDDNERIIKVPFPIPCTVSRFLRHFCDLTSPPSKQFMVKLENLLREVKSKLALNFSVEKFEALKFSCFRDFWEIVFANVDAIDFDFLEVFRILPRQRVRSFTGAGNLFPTLCCSLRPGLCSSFLCNQVNIGDTILCHIKKDSLIKRILFDENIKEIFFICTGAGIAAFRGSFDYFSHAKRIDVRISLIFGCRSADWDLLYEEELEEAKKSSLIVQVKIAFSKQESIHVQDLLNENELKSISSRNGSIVVCGSTSMCKDTVSLLKEFLGNDVIDRMVTDRRLLVEQFG